ncbi:hypothetical protein F5B22DRAFT_482685 [Xylaria bambusicola]|uniref:uncharacterized protein n=1 Tax=Xylaria bambusicola TaxID=326684 RepID=UPI002007345D|nr:uncharacterized protein F5B22DRAFT_482685 [Xylaria bambusicola]KAI0506071.1 hypothetical protein F5B22DRAFT_482685 [Xylaria bambusicola]
MATSTADFPLSTEDPYPGGSTPGGAVDDAAGAAGASPGAAQLSHGALIAIIVVVAVVVVGGISTAVLFYLAKKREWKVRESIRRSARKVVTALTPRRSEFPKSVKESSGRSSRGRVRLEDVPPTPRLRPEDIEKGLAKSTVRQSPEGRGNKWTRK